MPELVDRSAHAESRQLDCDKPSRDEYHDTQRDFAVSLTDEEDAPVEEEN